MFTARIATLARTGALVGVLILGLHLFASVAEAAVSLPAFGEFSYFSSARPACTLKATATRTQAGQDVTLTWTSKNATSVVLNPGFGEVAAQGSAVVSPAATTQYVLTAQGAGIRTARCAVTIYVARPSVPAPSCTLTADPTSIQSGDFTALTLVATNSVSASLNQGIGTVGTLSTTNVSPAVTTTYTATVRNSIGKQATCTAKVSVTAPPPPPPLSAPTCALSANPASVSKGQASMLSWSSTNASSASFDQGIGTVATSGTRSVTPTETTTYTGTFVGVDGQKVECSATVTVASVTPPPPPPAEGNLVSNGTFETVSTDPSSPQGWQRGGWGTNDGTYTYPVAGDGSTRAAEVSMTQYVSGDAKWFFAPVPVVPGVTYTYRDRYKATVPTNLTIEYTKSGGAKEYVWLGDAESSSAWRSFSGSFTVPAGVVAATVFHILAQPGTLTIDNVELTKNAATPGDGSFAESMVTLVFDDGLTSQNVHAVPMLNSAGLKATFAIITDIPHKGYDGYMSWAEIEALRDQGHEIGGHSRTHAHLTEISGAAQDSEIKGSYDDLVARGFSPKTFVYPYGEQNATVRAKVAQAGYSGARGVYLGYNDTSADRYLLSDQHIERGTTVAEAIAHIDAARAQKKWLIFELHEQSASAGQYANDPAVLQGIIDYLKSTNANVVTLAEGVELLGE